MSNLRHRRAQRIRDLADMGKTRREVAAELFMSYATVVNYGRQFGIKFQHASKGVAEFSRWRERGVGALMLITFVSASTGAAAVAFGKKIWALMTGG